MKSLSRSCFLEALCFQTPVHFGFNHRGVVNLIGTNNVRSIGYFGRPNLRSNRVGVVSSRMPDLQ